MAARYIMEWHTAPVRDATGKLLYWVTINRDITERTRAEEGTGSASGSCPQY